MLLKVGVSLVNLLSKIFIKNYKDIENPRVREAYGKMASIMGILSNVLLFIVKLVVGIIASSIAIIADSINNLSDLISSLVTLVGFKLSGKPADKEHPFGHQRIEYIAGLIVSIFVIIVGVSLFMTSIEKIIGYEVEPINKTFIYISILILAISILIKLWQSFFYLKTSKIINSVALEATSKDSRNDVVSTFIILIGNIVLLFTGELSFSLDGILGLAVSLFIVISGISLIKETTTPLIGESDSDAIKPILDFIESKPIVLSYHDPMCHTYGPTTCFMTIHIDVDASIDIIDIHEQIDDLEKAVKNKFGVVLTCHMDPVRLNDEETNEMRNITLSIIKSINEEFSIHDFRIAKKNGKDSLIFDVVIPYKCSLAKDEVINLINKSLEEKGFEYQSIIDVDYE